MSFRKEAGEHFPGLWLSAADRRALKARTKGRQRNSVRQWRGVRILELLHGGWNLKDTAAAVGTYPREVRRVGWRYLEQGLKAALSDDPRPKPSKKLDARQQAAVVAMVCGPPPENYRPGQATLTLFADDDKNRMGRPLPLSDRARAALDRVCPKQGLIFGSHDYREVLRAAAQRAGIDPDIATRVTVHCFRHSRLTYWGETCGDNLVGVQYPAGHKQPTTTGRYMKTSLRAAQAVLKRNSGSIRDPESTQASSAAHSTDRKTKSFHGVRGGAPEPPWPLTASTSRLEPRRKQ